MDGRWDEDSRMSSTPVFLLLCQVLRNGGSDRVLPEDRIGSGIGLHYYSDDYKKALAFQRGMEDFISDKYKRDNSSNMELDHFVKERERQFGLLKN